MSSARDIEIWDNAVQAYDSGSIIKAVEMFSSMGTMSSKISFNIGSAHLFLNDLGSALKSFQKAVDKDSHLAIGYFMTGISFFKTKRYSDAARQFEATIKCMRGNEMVDYKQIGLKYQLYESEVMISQAALYSKLGETEGAKAILLKGIELKTDKCREKMEKALNVLQVGNELEPVLPPTSAIFRPPVQAVKNLKKKDYLGKAKVLYAADPTDKDSGFSGLKMLQESRNTLLSDIRQPIHRQTLRKVSSTSKPAVSTLQLGKVMERPPPRKPLPQNPTEDPRIRAETWNGKPNKPLPKFPSQQAPSRPTNSPSFAKEQNIKSWTGKPSENSAFSTSNQDEKTESSTKQFLPQRPKKQLPMSPIVKKREVALADAAKVSSHAIDLEVQFNFSAKIRVDDKTSLDDLLNTIFSHSIPRDLSVCYEDGLGRQKKLTDVALEHIRQGTIDKPKLTCFRN